MRKILCLDDSRFALTTLEDALKDIAEVISTVSIQEAEKTLEKNDIDLVIVDFVLGDGNGIDFTKKIKSMDHYKEIEVILVTSTLTPNVRSMAMQSGVDYCISKPIDNKELKSLVSKLLKLPLALAADS